MYLRSYGPESKRSFFYCLFPGGSASDAIWMSVLHK